MKPVKLTIEGVNSFTDEQTLDFEAVGRNNLFCISGKTGAGKTTIFDSIMLALYGNCGKGNLADIVNLSRTTARVKFDFSESGELYTVERIIKCRFEKTSSGEYTDKRIATTDCMLYKNGVPVATGSDNANAFIADIIGLAESEFKNVYLLEQGEYADFLKKTPAKQTEAVGKIFSLMRFGDIHRLANERRREMSDRVAFTDERIAALGDVSPEKLHAEKTALASVRAKTTALCKEAETKRAELTEREKQRDVFIAVKEKQNAVKNLMLQADEAKIKRSERERRLTEFETEADDGSQARLSALRDILNELSALNAVDKEYAAAEKEAKLKSATYERKEEERGKAAESKDKLRARYEEQSAVLEGKIAEFKARAAEISESSEVLKRALEKCESSNPSLYDIAEFHSALSSELSRFEELVSAYERKKSEYENKKELCNKQLGIIEKFTVELKNAEDSRIAAENARSDAQAKLAAAQLCSHAAAVRAELHTGDRCPVCGGVYSGLSDNGDADVEKRKADSELAERQLEQARKREAECVKHTDRAKSEYENTVGVLKTVENELEEQEKKIAETRVNKAVYGVLLSVLAEARTVGTIRSEAEAEYKKIEPTLSALTAEAEAMRSSVAEINDKIERHKAVLGEKCGQTERLIAETKKETEALEKQIEKKESERKRLTAEVEAARAAVAAVENSLAAALAVCPVDMPDFDEEAYTEKKDELERLRKQIADNEKEIAVRDVGIKTLAETLEKQTALAAERKTFVKQADIYDELSELTKGKAMLNFVAEEYIARFTADASEILNGLSGGKYTMKYDRTNGFAVSDFLNEGKLRKTDTLSGGELFLASLSVAIAIARTQSNGNNAFFFLDEGFGTLDDELIDTVYGALEALSRDCLVGVISHASALIDRMPSCVEVLEATDSTGSRIKY